MRISDWSSDVCSSDLSLAAHDHRRAHGQRLEAPEIGRKPPRQRAVTPDHAIVGTGEDEDDLRHEPALSVPHGVPSSRRKRSEEHTSELQSLMCISYAVFFLNKKINTNTQDTEVDSEIIYHNMCN